jgi:hypothetical protein
MSKVYDPTPLPEDVPTQGHEQVPAIRSTPRRELAVIGSEDEADFNELMAVLASPSEDGDEEDDASRCAAVDLKTYLAGFDDGEDGTATTGHPARRGGV